MEISIQTITFEYLPIDILYCIIDLFNLIKMYVVKFVCKGLHSIAHNFIIEGAANL
jgi:hypothetical protein